jgi:hypothetical protein
MKRFALVSSVATILISGALLARAAWRETAADPISPTPTVTAAGALGGAAGWHYRHNQPTHWRTCLLAH